MKISGLAITMVLFCFLSFLFAAETTAPMVVRFDVQDPGKREPGIPFSLALIVERNPTTWEPLWKGEAQLELLLRLPAGVKLVSAEGWQPEPMPVEEEDISGPWQLYKRQQPVEVQSQKIPVGATAPRGIAEIPVSLAVTEEGTNWVITARARIVQGSQTWQGFGVIFATLQSGIAEFHTAPKNA